jgi:CheY-like chemotaxis protein
MSRVTIEPSRGAVSAASRAFAPPGIRGAIVPVESQGGLPMNETDLSQVLVPTASEGPRRAPRTAPLKIMVAEDSGALRRLLALVLERDGHEVVEARDAGELLEALASALIEEGDGDGEGEGEGEGRTPFDLVICEQSLPGVFGLSVLASLRSSDRTTPFILMTGDLEVQQRARHLGAVVLDHPFSVAAIRGAIRLSTDPLAAANDV